MANFSNIGEIMNQEINRRNIPKSGGYGASADASATTEWCEDPLSAKVSNEMEAAMKIIKSLEGLDGDAASRVMSYVVDLLDMHI
jgi:hypothetical protein